MKIVKFGSVGILNTLVSYLVFCVLIYFDVYYLTSSVLSFLVGSAFSYIMNSRYTFSVCANVRSFFKFITITAGSLFLSVLLLYIFKSTVGIHVLIAQILVVLIRFPIVYLLIKRMVFNQAHLCQR
ncbi:GtrA family protein [Vibrio parahaemolyticus]|uniref:GtrA family protein n=1 Tax=Vibrio parahaemolyticus TaxID=670 RepID=UPI00046FC8B0|nr:GtrA family protein [Vibrio parahaemolyticus]EJG0887387.1 GtrA family protein [Vibrio parahaemolyticus]MBE4236839.1 GtrA family protein [Vibrio parahaemolyticus]QOW06619.1 GtrA family protein [Vibrio parahaemolyticus]HCH0844696.1 GtrA family protein [Vibrio parahaemolyticus]HCH0846577.1 GtrA family protein [Vibrio parahaemolyticus]